MPGEPHGWAPAAGPPEIVSIPAQAWVEIDGNTFDAHDIALMYSAGAIPTANISLAVGYNFAGTKVFNSEALSLFTEGALGKVFVDFTGATDLPGLPRGVTMVFEGYVAAVSPSVGEDGTTLGIRLQHRGLSDLSSGSTIQWGSMLVTGAPYPADTALTMAGLTLTGGLLTSTGLMPVLSQIYNTYLAASGVNAGAVFEACTGVRDLNALALAALNTLGGSKLQMRVDLANDGAMFEFLGSRITSDLWTQSVAEQLQALGNDLFFRCIPRGDGSVDIRPLTTFSDAFATVDASHIFNFRPTNTVNRRVAGVVMLARVPNGSQDAASRVSGCYVFPSALVRAGAVQPIDLPAWMTTSIATSQRNVSGATSGVSMIGSPAVVGVVAESSVDTAQTVKASTERAARTYGDAFAREVARKIRYQDCVAEFTSHFRTDIGVLSTIRVKAPVALDQEATIYGRVDTLTLSISAQAGTALAVYGLSYVRSEPTQNSILEDGGSEHPLYTDTWTGSPL
jgi:hypothetical protein